MPAPQLAPLPIRAPRRLPAPPPPRRIPGLNAPIPPGAEFGYHAGGWGKPPVDDGGVPVYGDVFGADGADDDSGDELARGARWGALESEPEESSEEEEEEGEGEDEGEEGARRAPPRARAGAGWRAGGPPDRRRRAPACGPAPSLSPPPPRARSRPPSPPPPPGEPADLEGGIATDATGLTSAGLASTLPGGADSPGGVLNLRKSGDSAAGTESARAPQLFTVLQERRAGVGQVRPRTARGAQRAAHLPLRPLPRARAPLGAAPPLSPCSPPPPPRPPPPPPGPHGHGPRVRHARRGRGRRRRGRRAARGRQAQVRSAAAPAPPPRLAPRPLPLPTPPNLPHKHTHATPPHRAPGRAAAPAAATWRSRCCPRSWRGWTRPRSRRCTRRRRRRCGCGRRGCRGCRTKAWPPWRAPWRARGGRGGRSLPRARRAAPRLVGRRRAARAQGLTAAPPPPAPPPPPPPPPVLAPPPRPRPPPRQAAARGEDFSDMVAAQAAAQKRKIQQRADVKATKKAKGGADDFKF